ncbi:MAG: DEAD/DEAH box helicase [Prevotella sp.]|nr:DEAD/DEAH box helicase [Prevotella sp.]
MENRIKGTRYWDKYGKQRLYFNTRTWRDRFCNVSIWLEVVNDRLVFQVKAFHERKHEWEWDAIAESIKYEMSENYREIISGCEMKRKETPVNERLKDCLVPVSNAGMKHQVEALSFLGKMKVGALFSDVGTGKTKIAIDLAVSRFLAKRIFKVLVFCPVSTILNFQKEVEKFCREPDLIWEYVGIESMSSSIRAYEKAHLFTDSETMIVIDESHLVKTPKAIRSKLIKDICKQSSWKLIMTGTPIADHVHDLYMQYSMLSNLIMQCNTWTEYENRYVLYGGITGNDIVGYKNLDYLTGLIEPYTYQIRKEDCLDLPLLFNYTYSCNLTEKQEYVYFKTKEELLSLIDSDNYTSETIFLYLTRMQQITCGYYYDQSGEFIYIGTNKFELVNQIGLPERALFFCKYLFEIDLLTEFLGAENCAVFSGKNRKDRDREKELFVAGKRKYFVATASSGGTGLNGLQTCNVMFRFSRTFKYIEDKQTVGRIERPGQTQNMFIYDLVTDSGIDIKIQRNINRKSNLDAEIKRILNDKQKLREYISEI